MSRRLGVHDRVGPLLVGILLLALTAVGATVALPASEASLAPGGRPSELELRGMEIYRSEGCWYCHTGQVRSTSTDDNLGTVSEPGDYPDVSPVMLGEQRVGPDLSHAGTDLDETAMRRLLQEGGRGMPSSSHLSKREVDALIAYLRSRQ